jgi:hypothetical protein
MSEGEAQRIAEGLADYLDFPADGDGVRYRMAVRVRVIDMEQEFRNRSIWRRDTFIEDVAKALKEMPAPPHSEGKG